MRIHFIAVGGSIMHNLALALKNAGHDVTGSDDEIYDPARSRLEIGGILPAEMGWNPNRINKELDAVILGMHARQDNPELARAIELNIRVYSFPEFVSEQSSDKKRVVIAGSHGKTSTTSMIMHVLRNAKSDFDYLVGAQLPDFELMVHLSDAPVIVIEGDEYLSSPLDRRPKFFHYKPHISAITGVAWDHMNVFPTLENYISQFDQYLESLPDNAVCFYFENDRELKTLAAKHGNRLNLKGYKAVPHSYTHYGAVVTDSEGGSYVMQIFGSHNFENMQAARLICSELGINDHDFFKAMKTFKGASMRLQEIYTSDSLTVFRDFAHAPSKVQATVRAIRERFPKETVTAIVELHTFSSLNKDFIPQYKGALDSADHRFVYYSPHTLEIKKLPPVSKKEICDAFGGNVEVFTSIEDLVKAIPSPYTGIHLWMSSGRFGDFDINKMYTTD